MRPHSYKLSHRSGGFTLIEVMVTVAIVAILAAIAVPNYQDYVRRGRIVEATTALADLRAKLEQYFLDNRRYNDGSPANPAWPCATAQLTTLNTRLQHFTVTCATPNANSYTITATGKPTMTGFAYTLNQNNTRATTSLPAGWGTAPTTCWAIRKGGGCS
jgi:type IV pilus assembly protein PilE